MISERSKEWIMKKENELRKEVESISRIEMYLKQLDEPTSRKDELIFKLNLLVDFFDENPMVTEIFEELLKGFSYTKKRGRRDANTAFVIGAFELEITEKDVLRVINTNLAEYERLIAEEEKSWNGKYDEYISIFEKQKLGAIPYIEAARKLHVLEMKRDGVVAPSIYEYLFGQVKSLYKLRFGNLRKTIYTLYKKEEEVRDKYLKELKTKYEMLLHQDVLEMKKTGLYDFLRQLEEDSSLFISVNTILFQHSVTNDLDVMDAYEWPSDNAGAEV